MNIKELVASIEIELEAAEQRELRARKEMELLLVTAQQEMRSDLSPEDDSRFAALKETVQNARVDQASIKRKLAKARQVQADEARTDDDLANATAPESLPRRTDVRTASVSVGREERTYHRGNDPTGKMFLNDLVKQFTTNDARAAGRLQQHMREEAVERSQQGMELRAGEVGTGAFSGLVVPQYLVDMVAPHVANLRPFADICNKHPLPASGMSLNISRITTASKVELQTAENAAQANPTAMDDTLLTINVQTALGQQTISRQAIERGTGIEDVVMQDLFRQHATLLDSTMLNQATHGLTNVANNISGNTTATLAGLYPAILGAASQSETATLGMAHPTYAIMHPRRWYWLQSLLTTQWPAFTQPGVDPRAAGDTNNTPYNAGVHGVLPSGLKVVTDANVLTNGGTATNQDEMYVVPDVECHLWEEGGNPTYIRAEQPPAASLGVLLVVYSYFAFTYERYTNATQKLTGTALAAPSGFWEHHGYPGGSLPGNSGCGFSE